MNKQSNVVIGKGKLAGKGLYANRDFKKGELVNSWNLKELSQADFDALPKNEHMFVHSFWGKMYLFPEPSRYTNHSSDPNVVSDFEKMCDFAARSIKKGEMITVNATDEIKFELKTFLEAYEKATNSRDFKKVAPFIAENAEFTFTNGIFKGKKYIQNAFEDTWKKIQKEKYTISDVVWTKTGYRNSICVYSFVSDGIIDGIRQVYSGKGKNILRRMDGNWRIIEEHLTKQ